VWSAERGITIERILTDNGNGYRSHSWRRRCAELGITHTKPYHPATNGKVERFKRTLVNEWAYTRLWTSDSQRAQALDPWLHRYDHRRLTRKPGQQPRGAQQQSSNLIGVSPA